MSISHSLALPRSRCIVATIADDIPLDFALEMNVTRFALSKSFLTSSRRALISADRIDLLDGSFGREGKKLERKKYLSSASHTEKFSFIELADAATDADDGSFSVTARDFF